MRIIRGKLKRIRFYPPKGFPSRPTTDFAKEGLFNLLENERDLIDLKILDLFAGTGNISFEFASRESGDIVAVDSNVRCVQYIRDFAKKYQLDGLTVIKADVFRYLRNSVLPNDLVFADPPFDFDKYNELIEQVLAGPVLKKDGLFVLEHDKFSDFSEHPNFIESRKYGGIIFTFFKHIS